MINFPYLNQLRKQIAEKNDAITPQRIKWIRGNRYYYNQLLKTLRFIIPPESRVLHIRSGIGYILNELQPSYGVAVDDSSNQTEEAKKLYPHLKHICESPESFDLGEKFDYIIVSSIEDIVDVKAVFDNAYKHCDRHTRLVVVHYNYLWEPLTVMAEKAGLRIPQKLHNWFGGADVNNMLTHSGFDKVIQRRLILFPFFIPILSYILNRFVAHLPIFKSMSLIRVNVARPMMAVEEDYTVSVVIPCRNEAGNIEDAVMRIPQLGKGTEIIFGDDKSTDGTPDIVRQMMAKFPEKNIRLVNSPGICKAMNVWTCFDEAKNDILMILDADLTVIPEELPYFYEAIKKQRGEFINGSRLVYPMHSKAMPFFNVLGNKFFSLAFTYILDTPIKDTLCGTKVIFRRDFAEVKKLRNSWGINDRWGDYELIFGAAKMHLKIVDLPVHYYERTYGETKMTGRIKNGLIMLKMCRAALMKIKFH
jgi:hypothetical protein